MNDLLTSFGGPPPLRLLSNNSSYKFFLFVCCRACATYVLILPTRNSSIFLCFLNPPRPATIPTGGGSQDYDVSEDITVYVDANDNEYYYTTSSQYGFYDYDYSAFDDYTAEFDKDRCVCCGGGCNFFVLLRP